MAVPTGKAVQLYELEQVGGHGGRTAAFELGTEERAWLEKQYAEATRQSKAMVLSLKDAYALFGVTDGVPSAIPNSKYGRRVPYAMTLALNRAGFTNIGLATVQEGQNAGTVVIFRPRRQRAH